MRCSYVRDIRLNAFFKIYLLNDREGSVDRVFLEAAHLAGEIHIVEL